MTWQPIVEVDASSEMNCPLWQVGSLIVIWSQFKHCVWLLSQKHFAHSFVTMSSCSVFFSALFPHPKMSKVRLVLWWAHCVHSSGRAWTASVLFHLPMTANESDNQHPLFKKTCVGEGGWGKRGCTVTNAACGMPKPCLRDVKPRGCKLLTLPY